MRSDPADCHIACRRCHDNVALVVVWLPYSDEALVLQLIRGTCHHFQSFTTLFADGCGDCLTCGRCTAFGTGRSIRLRSQRDDKHSRRGCSLRQNIFRPKGDGPFPKILSRTPYGKGGQEQRAGAIVCQSGLCDGPSGLSRMK